ncbi:hypothetical protein A2716_01375 [candidate division WWE3 bacterium RIFCSPHIGHO2_01_FULL_40_23]|uniref:50S ribosomal protein L35 n=1 Tax=candidate division WWE3 bacterium RIFCSPLOWO2_01_FULL_41_18 TaxID=1802625 RepID=A0A1F4VDQ0_UNCKA|nr:MAG: hypothetical protein A2716_01375 [candidate division WWE3 bacterium RIFCSPHIGHO2_01_FULL_40_23]OGC55381.1 MAG: hypothetical protein A3A78_00280 [candidate division WWE3 bacterium RIFCSPLOWO2_01_FULL_41_18]
MKLKSKKTLQKRIKVTGSGKLLRKRIRTSHLKVKLTAGRKHRKRRYVLVARGFTKTLKNMLPYNRN